MRVHIFRQIRRNKRDLPSLIWTFLALCFLFAMVDEPAVVFAGAAEGLKVWWEIIFPSLLPFFVASELLMKLGFVHFIGVLLEPIMRPIFNVPGSGGFVLVLGMVGGSPVNGLLISQLREKQLCTKTEGERLLCFTNFATPLFMISAVAVGMLGRPELGILIAGTHYLANFIIGISLRFYKNNEIGTGNRTEPVNSIKNAFVTMLQYQRKHRQTIAKLLNDAVASSILKLLNVGGFIILFAVIIRIFSHVGLIEFIASTVAMVLVPLGFSTEVMPSIASGLFETTIGSTMASQAMASELQKVMAIGFMLGWSGLSIHAQVGSMVAGDIGLRLFIITRIIHAFLVAGLTWVLYLPSQKVITQVLPAIAPSASFDIFPTYRIVLCLLLLACLLLTLFVILATVIRAIRN